MHTPDFSSASGLRPMSAFVVIAVVVSSVAGWVVRLTSERGSSQPDRVELEVGTLPEYAIVDREGRPLARFVPRFDLVMSPRSMWQAHTPRYMADRISAVLGGDPAPEELVATMLPDADAGGRLAVDAWRLSARQANRLVEWIEHGERAPVRGIGFEAWPDDPAAFRLVWRPDELLSRGVRAEQGHASAWTWARRVASAIERAVVGTDTLEPRTAEEREAGRQKVWRALLPTAHEQVLDGLPAERVIALRALLEEEGVAPWQMSVVYERDRVYPAGNHELFGSWGFQDPQQTRPQPRSGLELLSDRLLSEERWAALDVRPPVYAWTRDRAVLGQRANGFLGYAAPSSPPVVRSTIDLALEAHVRDVLEALFEEHQPAVAMAIVLDVADGDVLAVEAVERYPIAPFAPVYHAFTPGSTFKAITMAIALEEGAVRPDEMFQCGATDQYRLMHPDGKNYRTIHEAEGAKGGSLSAAACLAWSVNAGMAQIGLRVPDVTFRGYCERLGYGRAVGSGLGIENGGLLPRTPWKYLYTHAVISFGHELMTTLWQHATALATIARGGVWRPLRLTTAVELDGSSSAIEPEPGERVFSRATCDELRSMMSLGFREGTGKDVIGFMRMSPVWSTAADALEASGIALFTKTGTAHKVPTELCLHLELEEQDRCRREGLTWTRERRRALRSKDKPHRSCYTSSMCVLARHPVTGRELMVLVVADEPTGKQKFGSKVAGPAALTILAEALDLTRAGEVGEEPPLEGFASSTSAVRNELDAPWRLAAAEGGTW